MDAFVEGKDGVADGGIIRQAEVFLRGTRGRGWMAMPVGENLQTVLTSVLQRSKLIFRGEREMFRGVVDILHPVVLRHYVAILATNTQQVTARLIRCVLPGLANQFMYNILWNLHHLVVFEVASGLFVIYQMVDSWIRATNGA